MATSLCSALGAEPWDTELRDLDISGWSCLTKAAGSAKSPPEAERNLSKNRPPSSNAKPMLLDLKSFLQLAHGFDQQYLRGARHRAELIAEQKTKLLQAENQVVTVTGWLVWVYPGPAESTNCGDPYHHDWHLELLEEPLDHPPGVGDPTAIICEITPRTEADLYRQGIRLQDLAAYVRLENNTAQPTGHSPHRISVTGLMMWDDAHSGRTEVGPAISGVDAVGLGHPWRRTAWEVHPIWKVVDLGTKETRN
jgi:hypothetical protein